MTTGTVQSDVSAAVELRRRDEDDLQELLTVEEVAALLKVSKSWVYNTRARGGRDQRVCRT